MAMDVILPYEQSQQRPLPFSDITDVKTVRAILDIFKSSAGLSSSTKLRHLSLFELFMEFLITASESPEPIDDATTEELL